MPTFTAPPEIEVWYQIKVADYERFRVHVLETLTPQELADLRNVVLDDLISNQKHSAFKSKIDEFVQGRLQPGKWFSRANEHVASCEVCFDRYLEQAEVLKLYHDRWCKDTWACRTFARARFNCLGLTIGSCRQSGSPDNRTIPRSFIDMMRDAAWDARLIREVDDHSPMDGL